MSNPKYITLTSNLLALKSLLSELNVVLTAGVPALTMTGPIAFTDDVGATRGGLRYNAGSGALEYTNDDGGTWNELSSDSFVWESGISYADGAVVLHNNGWYRCTTATASAIPGSTAEWALLTPGTLVQYVTSSEQFKKALETAASVVSIVIQGKILTDVTAMVTASTITIHSDDASEIRGDLDIAIPFESNVYWYSSGTRTYGNTIAVSTGTLWVDRLTNTGATPLTLTGAIQYQRIEGSFTGGDKVRWNAPDVADLVPKDLSTLGSLSFNNDMKLFVDSSTGKGYITISTLATEVAKSAEIRLDIDLVGVLADRPATAAKGFAFYAEDTGDLHIMGPDNVWRSPAHIRGPKGDQGDQGDPGVDVGEGLKVHKFQVVKPASAVPLWLQIRRSTTDKFADSVLCLDTKDVAADRVKVKSRNLTTLAWDTMTSAGFDSNYNGSPVIVDLSAIHQERYIFFRWVTQTASDVPWEATIFPSSNPAGTSTGGDISYVIEHDHGNKPALDLFYIDVVGNLVMDGVVVVPADERGGGLYLVYPEAFADTLELLDAGVFTINEPVVQPGRFSAVKLLEQANSPIYNLDMNILNPYSYNTDPPVVDPGDFT